MILIVTGATGGIGSCVVKKAMQSPAVEKIYGMYRKEEKFNHLFAHAENKLVRVRYNAAQSNENLQFLHALREINCETVVCVHTAFCLEPLLRVGTYLPEDIKKNVSVNVVNMVLLVNELIRLHHTKGIRLRIINIDSGAADRPLEGWGLYCASKAYANMFLKTVRLENPQVGIVSYEPGVVDTPMQEKIRQTDSAVCGQTELFRAYFEKGMLRSPETVAADILARFVENWDVRHFKEGYRTE
ncbi:Benzil reductase ((S)-benzoin forming) [Eubacterium plexicaudatum ASF492]|uniref:Benzil reductase ((S)-benzoin forming) n=1 Tax=Eubacterium plexicaudatum ASF492 TaxID=1235802 RepID=N2BF09_9FIRM|nr:Benzil reductase ((S)-benzoin forming) [Eubacterium plexicaudatum ASF492]